MSQDSAVTAVVVGAGLRGRFTYGRLALADPKRLRIVAVAEPDRDRRGALAAEHGIAPEDTFVDWKNDLVVVVRWIDRSSMRFLGMVVEAID